MLLFIHTTMSMKTPDLKTIFLKFLCDEHQKCRYQLSEFLNNNRYLVFNGLFGNI